MPIPEKYQVDFCERKIYHVFNRTNNKERLFLNDENHMFFLKKYDQYLSPYLETFAWCLLPNHFHLIVRVKSESEINRYMVTPDAMLSTTEKKFQYGEVSFSELIEHAFKRFFQSYALAFNKVNKRNGNLFYKPFRRLEIESDSHFTQVIIYTHANPVKHRLTKDFTEWKWSSWKSLVSETPTKLCKKELLEWFGGLDQFIRMHKEMIDFYYESEISIED